MFFLYFFPGKIFQTVPPMVGGLIFIKLRIYPIVKTKHAYHGSASPAHLLPALLSTLIKITPKKPGLTKKDHELLDLD